MATIPIPCPGRVRCIAGTFAWLDHRMLREGHFEKLTRDEIALYTFLVLVANRYGVSYYSQEKICRYLDKMDLDHFLEVRDSLVEKGLVCFQPFHRGSLKGFHQVLSVVSAEGGNNS